MKLGVIREGKNPPDKRVPLSPKQCAWIIANYPKIELVVQRSEIRKFNDEEYEKQQVTLVDNVDDCDVLLGVKEVPIDELIPMDHQSFFCYYLLFVHHHFRLN